MHTTSAGPHTKGLIGGAAGTEAVLGGEGRGAAVDLPVHKQMELVVSSSGRNGGDTARGNLEQC